MIRTGLIASAITIPMMAGLTYWTSGLLPAENIPVHWNSEGIADRFADRAEAVMLLWIMPATALVLTALFAALPQLDPLRENLYKSRKAYNAVWIVNMLLFLGIHGGICYMTVQANAPETTPNEFVRFVIAGSGVLFVVLGNYLPKTRQNWFLGIRTPWTLSSEYTWEKTHRLAGRLFFAAGLFIILSAFILNGVNLIISICVASGCAALVSAAYSLLVYQKAPDKRINPDYIV